MKRPRQEIMCTTERVQVGHEIRTWVPDVVNPRSATHERHRHTHYLQNRDCLLAKTVTITVIITETRDSRSVDCVATGTRAKLRDWESTLC